MVEAIPIYTSDILAGSFDSLPPCTVTAIIFFGSIIFTSVSMATKAWLSGDMRGKRRIDFKAKSDSFFNTK